MKIVIIISMRRALSIIRIEKWELRPMVGRRLGSDRPLISSTATMSHRRFRRKHRRSPLSRILSLERLFLSLEHLSLSLERLWFWNLRKYFSAQLYRQKSISHLPGKSL